MAVDISTTRFSDLCRLCATKTGLMQGLNIFANDANYQQIFKKIEACLPLQISESDVLPKMVCENCLYKVELLFEFRERALHTESVLIELFKQLHHPIPFSHHHSMPLDDVIASPAQSLLNDIDLPQLSHRESMIMHNVPLNQLSQHDINQELPPVTYNAIEYQHHHTLPEDLGVHPISKSIVDHPDAYSALNHEKTANMPLGGMQKLMMNEAHFMNDDENIDSIISSYFCNICAKGIDGKTSLEDHCQEHFSKAHDENSATQRKMNYLPNAVECPQSLDIAQFHTKLSDDISDKCLPQIDAIDEEHEAQISSEGESHKKPDSFSDESDYFDGNLDGKEEEEDKIIEEIDGKSAKRKNFTPKVCGICGKECKSNYKLTEHMRRHTGEQPFKCGSCEKTFRSKIGLAQHEATHTGQFVFSCTKCGKGFQCKSYLMVHQRAHSDLKPFPCTTCGRSFKTKQSLLDHTNRHLGIKPHACDKCKRSFITAGLLRAHEKTHQGTDNRKHACLVCNKMFVSKSYLQMHSKIHTGDKPYKCDVCGKGFLARVDLKVHSTMHTGEKSYVCEMCGKAFARKDALRCHMRSHTGERPYKCDICGQTFTQFSPMAIHKRYHTGERPYECSVCGKKFVSKSTMMVHFKKHDKL